MSVEMLQQLLGWSTVLNVAILIAWVAMFVLAHDWMYRYHSRFAKLSVETFDAIHYAGMAVFKIGIFLLNLCPYLALWMVK